MSYNYGCGAPYRYYGPPSSTDAKLDEASAHSGPAFLAEFRAASGGEVKEREVYYGIE